MSAILVAILLLQVSAPSGDALQATPERPVEQAARTRCEAPLGTITLDVVPPRILPSDAVPPTGAILRELIESSGCFAIWAATDAPVPTNTRASFTPRYAIEAVPRSTGASLSEGLWAI